jgi:hypothetical protein
LQEAQTFEPSGDPKFDAKVYKLCVDMNADGKELSQECRQMLKADPQSGMQSEDCVQCRVNDPTPQASSQSQNIGVSVGDILKNYTSPLAKGALKKLAILYQSCDVLNETVSKDVDLGKPGVRHPYRKLSYGGKCTDPAAEFDEAGRPKLYNSDNFVGFGLEAAGLRSKWNGQVKSQSPVGDRFSTADLLTLKPGDTQSCFEPAAFTKNSPSIASGDIISVRAPGSAKGESVIVERAGLDPFGISSLRTAEQCKKDIDPSKFDFTLSFASSRMGGGLGPIRMKALDFILRAEAEKARSGLSHDMANAGSAVLGIALRACLAQLSTKKSRALFDIHQIDASGVDTKKSVSIAISKHRSQEPKCRLSGQARKTTIGLACVKECVSE